MAEENTPSIGGFDLLSDMLVGGTSGDLDDGRKAVNEPPIVDPEIIKAELGKGEEAENTEKNETNTENTGDSTEDITGDSTDTGDGSVVDSGDSGENIEQTGSSDVVVDDLGEFESDVTELLNSKFSEELGWDIPKEEAPKTVKEFVDMMKGVVSEASKPIYANDEVKAYDEYVRNGGDLREFYKNTVEGRVDPEGIDLDSSFDQKKVVSEHLTNQGYSEDRIGKMLKRWEDAGTLEQEASDALELLKDYNSKNEQALLEEQKNKAAAVEEQQQKFVSSVQDSIKDLDSILGYKLSDKDKKELEDSILTVDADGYTPYQRKYMSNIKNLLDSAFVTMKGDTLSKTMETQSKSDAVKNLHDKLKANKGNRGRQSGTPDTGKTSSGLSVLGSMLQGNN